MPSIDIDNMLQGITPDAPAGESLDYDPVYAELERIARGKPEQQMGTTIIPAEEPNWRDVKAKAAELLNRSKDLRVAVYLARALLKLDGLNGFREGLALIRELLDRFWDTLHPQLDPEDDNDPTMRVNALAPLTDSDGTLRALREAILVESRAVGRFTYRDFQLATGSVPAPAGKTAPELASIHAAFADAPLESVQATEQTLTQSMEHVRAVETSLTDRIGSEQTSDLSQLTNLLRNIRQVVAEQLSRRTGEAPSVVASDSPVEAIDGNSTPMPEAAGPTAGGAPGEIRTRDDVVKTLEKICDYYERYEPSSPLPLLLKRAKRLVKKSFVEIIRDIAPDALSQVENIRGVDMEE